MYVFFAIIAIIAALFMVGIVLIQEPKGGLTSDLGEYKRAFGVHRTNSIIEKGTWILAGIMVIFSVLCTWMIS